jgi:hypothetical protein
VSLEPFANNAVQIAAYDASAPALTTGLPSFSAGEGREHVSRRVPATAA